MTAPLVVNTFLDHVDAIPYYVGYVPDDCILVTAVHEGGRLQHRLSPLEPVLAGGNLSALVDLDYRGAKMVLVVALGKHRVHGEAALREAVAALRGILGPLTGTPLAVPRVSAGWAAAHRYAEMQRDGSLGVNRPREINSHDLLAITAGEDVPPANHAKFLQQLRHTGKTHEHRGALADQDVSEAARRLMQEVDPDMDDCTSGLLSRASANPHHRDHLAGLITITSAEAWLKVWHHVAVHSSNESRAAAYTLAAFSAWTAGRGIYARDYLSFALKADSSSPMAMSLDHAVRTGDEPTTWAALGHQVVTAVMDGSNQ